MGRKRIHPLPEKEPTRQEALEMYIKSMLDTVSAMKVKIEEHLEAIEAGKRLIKDTLVQLSQKRGMLILEQVSPIEVGSKILFTRENEEPFKGIFEIRYEERTGDAFPVVRLYNKTGELSKKVTNIKPTDIIRLAGD